MAHYKIQDMAVGLDGLIIEGTPVDGGALVAVRRFINRDVMFGDRSPSIPVEGLFVDPAYLQELPDFENRQFASDNPFGTLQFEGRYVGHGLEVAYAKFERKVQVTVLEKESDYDVEATRTLFTHYFDADDFDKLTEAIEEHMYGDFDPDDLVFVLGEIAKGDL
jgi:hypothetical protein